jgi:hypothetical protein
MRKNAKMRKDFVTVVRCDTNFGLIFASHLHFALFHTFLHFFVFFAFWHFLAYFAHFSRTFHNFLVHNREILTKMVEKGRKCDKNAKISAMRMQNANAMRK